MVENYRVYSSLEFPGTVRKNISIICYTHCCHTYWANVESKVGGISSCQTGVNINLKVPRGLDMSLPAALVRLELSAQVPLHLNPGLCVLVSVLTILEYISTFTNREKFSYLDISIHRWKSSFSIKGDTIACDLPVYGPPLTLSPLHCSHQVRHVLREPKLVSALHCSANRLRDRFNISVNDNSNLWRDCHYSVGVSTGNWFFSSLYIPQNLIPLLSEGM